MTELGQVGRIHEYAQAICGPYGIHVVKIDALEETAGGGFAVSVWIPAQLSWDGAQLKEIRSKLENIDGVTRMWQLLAPDPT